MILNSSDLQAGTILGFGFGFYFNGVATFDYYVRITAIKDAEIEITNMGAPYFI